MKASVSALPILSGLLAGMVTWAMLGIGITLTPDGWAYWEGSVSILYGNGYEYFGGMPIKYFPPLYSVYLAGVQSLLEVSGRALMMATVALSVATASAWSYLACRMAARDAKRSVLVTTFSIYAALYVGTLYTALLAETLVLFWLPFLIHWSWIFVTREKVSFGLMLVLSAISFLILLTKNSGMVFLISVAAVMVLYRVRSVVADGLRVLVMMGVAVTGWLGIRFLLGQFDSHPVDGSGRFSLLQYVTQLLKAIQYSLGPDQLYIGWILLGLVVLVIGFAQWESRSSNQMSPGAFIAIFLVVSSIALILIFRVTWVNDELNGRFIWHIPILILFALMSYGKEIRGVLFALLLAVMMISTAIQTMRTVSHLRLRLSSPAAANVQHGDFIQPDYFSKSAVERDGRRLVSPEDHPWIVRKTPGQTN